MCLCDDFESSYMRLVAVVFLRATARGAADCLSAFAVLVLSVVL